MSGSWEAVPAGERSWCRRELRNWQCKCSSGRGACWGEERCGLGRCMGRQTPWRALKLAARAPIGLFTELEVRPGSWGAPLLCRRLVCTARRPQPSAPPRRLPARRPPPRRPAGSSSAWGTKVGHHGSHAQQWQGQEPLGSALQAQLPLVAEDHHHRGAGRPLARPGAPQRPPPLPPAAGRRSAVALHLPLLVPPAGCSQAARGAPRGTPPGDRHDLQDGQEGHDPVPDRRAAARLARHRPGQVRDRLQDPAHPQGPG